MTATQTVPETGTKTTWKIDPSHTIVEFSAKHLMISTVKGRITDIEGTILADENELANSSVDVTLKAASIDTRTEQRDNHLRSSDFLHAEQFPVITFRSTKIEGDREDFSLTGDLTIRGVASALASAPLGRSIVAISDLPGISCSKRAARWSETRSRLR